MSSAVDSSVERRMKESEDKGSCHIANATLSNRTDSQDKNVCQTVFEHLSCSSNLPGCCVLRCHSSCALFVAWNGVLVLVYQGFPPALVRAKQCLGQGVVPRLKRENFGSKWPKTTLAAVRNDAQALSWHGFQRLKNICTEYSQRMVSGNNTAGVEPIVVTKLSAVEYSCRSLEKLHNRVDIPLRMESTMNHVESVVAAEEKAIVDCVVDEWNQDLAAYLAKVNAPGSRIGSYREQSHQGATCVIFLHPLPGAVRKQIANFRTAIDKEFPGRYVWLHEESLHCTLRSLDQEEIFYQSSVESKNTTESS